MRKYIKFNRGAKKIISEEVKFNPDATVELKGKFSVMSLMYIYDCLKEIDNNK